MRNTFRILLILVLFGSFVSVAPARASVQPPEIEATQQADVDFPSSITLRLTAESPAPVTSAELRYAWSGMEYSNAAVVSFDETSSVDTEYTIDTVTDYIEPGVDVSYYWVLSDSNGPVARTSEQTVTWIDDSLDWQRLESADVILFSYSDDPDFDQYILKVAQDSADKFEQEYDIATIKPVRVWVYAKTSDFAASLMQNSESWIGGISSLQGGVIAAAIEPGDDFSVDRLISHEISHHVFYQATSNPFSYPPVWLDEGLAVVGQLRGNEYDMEVVLGALAEGNLPTLRTLSSSFPTDTAAATRSYATSHLAVQYIIDTWGQEAITKLVQQFRNSATTDEALIAVTGLDTEGLDAQFRGWLATQSD